MESGDRARAEVWKSEDGNKIFSEIKLKFVTGEKSLTFQVRMFDYGLYYGSANTQIHRFMLTSCITIFRSSHTFETFYKHVGRGSDLKERSFCKESSEQLKVEAHSQFI